MITRRRFLVPAFLLATLGLAFAPTRSLADMDRYRWSHRPLLIIVPDAADPLITGQQAALTDAEGFAERDMVLILVIGEQTVTVDGTPDPSLDPHAIRARYRVVPGASQVLLVGKDGGVKRRLARVIPQADLFAQIDAMPMRRREMHAPD